MLDNLPSIKRPYVQEENYVQVINENENKYIVNEVLYNRINELNTYSKMNGLRSNLKNFSNINFINTTYDFKNKLFKSFLENLGINTENFGINIDNSVIYNKLFKCLLGTIHFNASNRATKNEFQWSTYTQDGYYMACCDNLIAIRKHIINNVISEINNIHSLITYVRIIRFRNEIKNKYNDIHEYIDPIDKFLESEITDELIRANFIKVVSSCNQLYPLFNYLHKKDEELTIDSIISFISESNTYYQSNNLNNSNNKIIPDINNNSSFPTLGNETNDINTNQKKKNKSKPQKQTSINSSNDLTSTNM
jgi:hypothetical protein